MLMIFYTAMEGKKTNACLSAPVDRSPVRPIRKGIIWSGEGSERPRSRSWLQHGADLQLENNDGCLGQHWWRGSDRTGTRSPDIHPLTRRHERACWCAATKTHFCVSRKCAGMNPDDSYSGLNMCPRLLTRGISQTTPKPKQVNKPLPIYSAQIKQESSFALQHCV